MLSRYSSLSLVALLSCISVVVSSPIQSSASLYRRGRSVLIGYRYVSAQKAAEYNYYGTLTGVGASGTQLGDGAYISSDINEWQVADDYWQCAIFADETKFRNVAKLYISENSNTFFSSSRLNAYLTRARLDPVNTVLWSKIDGDVNQHIQMVIPPYFLRWSPAFRGAYGNGDLGITVICKPKSQQNTNYYGNAGWGGTWNIPGYGCDFSRRRDGSDSCPLPSPVAPIEIASSLIPSPSGDISTVSSYSFSETPITATSTALESGMSYFPSGVSSAVPSPVSGVSTGSIVFVSSSAFSIPSPIPSSFASGSASGAASGVSSASGSTKSGAGASSSAPASSAKISAAASASASGHGSAASSSVPASLAKSSAAASSASKPAASSKAVSSAPQKSSAPPKSSAVKPSAKPTTTKPATTKKPVATKGH